MRVLSAARAVLAALALTLAACEDTTSPYNTGSGNPHLPPVRSDDPVKPGIFGEGGLFGSTPKSNEQGGGGGGIGVNAYLWRASLDTISFLPLTSADPFGGVIITDWYEPPESPNERLKLTILIMDRQLRSDGIRVSVFRQTRDSQGNWVDSKVDPKMPVDLENAILSRARELRLAAAKS